MDQSSIIRDLVYWIDSHLEQPLSLDDVSAKSGYSKWHLQRMFKHVTDQAIGTYIRKRRLTQAAIALRMTSRSILEIAFQYHFDSQQTFTRAFKKQFHHTPAYFRRMPYAETAGFCPPINIDHCHIPHPEYITLPEQSFIGTTKEYTSTLEQMAKTSHQAHYQAWREYLTTINPAYLSKNLYGPQRLYGIQYRIPSKKNEDEQDVFFTTAIIENDIPQHIELKGERIIVPKADYAKFSYTGPASGLFDFILSIFTVALPMLKATISNTPIIEIIYPEPEHLTQSFSDDVKMNLDFLVPIIKDVTER